ncbi:MAG: glycosyltransferase family 1 protein [Deltaproteobacteria bacterium]|nr:glycosyltransferase family 1 protein [Deltaproteobacteria bacterium]
MKIALAHKRLDLKGGTERDLFKTAEGLRDHGHDVHLFCAEYGVAPPAGVTAHRVSVLGIGRTARLWSFARRAPRLIEQSGCDVVIGFGRLIEQDILRCGGGTHRGFLARLGSEGSAARRLWQKVSLYHRTLLALERRQYAAPRLQAIIAVSTEVKCDILENYPVADERIAVLYNGVDLERFHPAKRRQYGAEVRARWQIPADAPLVLFVGSGFRRKGLDRLLALWSLPEFGKIYLLVVGSDARLASYQARAEGIAPRRIIFAGRQDDIEKYFAAADVVALPALQEAFGNVVLEALASGLPVLVSRDVGAAEVLTRTLSGSVVDDLDDSVEFSGKLLALLHRVGDPALGHAARKIAEDYSWQRHFDRLDELLQQVSGRAPARVS